MLLLHECGEERVRASMLAVEVRANAEDATLRGVVHTLLPAVHGHRQLVVRHRDALHGIDWYRGGDDDRERLVLLRRLHTYLLQDVRCRDRSVRDHMSGQDELPAAADASIRIDIRDGCLRDLGRVAEVRRKVLLRQERQIGNDDRDVHGIRRDPDGRRVVDRSRALLRLGARACRGTHHQDDSDRHSVDGAQWTPLGRPGLSSCCHHRRVCNMRTAAGLPSAAGSSALISGLHEQAPSRIRGLWRCAPSRRARRRLPMPDNA